MEREMKIKELLFNGKYEEALKEMPYEYESFGIRLKSKPLGSEMIFVHKDVINVWKNGENEFSYDNGYSSSYRSSLTLDEMVKVFDGYKDWKITDIKMGTTF